MTLKMRNFNLKKISISLSCFPKYICTENFFTHFFLQFSYLKGFLQARFPLLKVIQPLERMADGF